MGGNPSSIQIAAGIELAEVSVEASSEPSQPRPMDYLLFETKEWLGMGATDIVLDTRRCGLASGKGHIDAIDRFNTSMSSLVTT